VSGRSPVLSDALRLAEPRSVKLGHYRISYGSNVVLVFGGYGCPVEQCRHS